MSFPKENQEEMIKTMKLMMDALVTHTGYLHMINDQLKSLNTIFKPLQETLENISHNTTFLKPPSSPIIVDQGHHVDNVNTNDENMFSTSDEEDGSTSEEEDGSTSDEEDGSTSDEGDVKFGCETYDCFTSDEEDEEYDEGDPSPSICSEEANAEEVGVNDLFLDSLPSAPSAPSAPSPQGKNVIYVNSESDCGKIYKVNIAYGTCECPDYQYRHKDIPGYCKHLGKIMSEDNLYNLSEKQFTHLRTICNYHNY